VISVVFVCLLQPPGIYGTVSSPDGFFGNHDCLAVRWYRSKSRVLQIGIWIWDLSRWRACCSWNHMCQLVRRQLLKFSRCPDAALLSFLCVDFGIYSCMTVTEKAWHYIMFSYHYSTAGLKCLTNKSSAIKHVLFSLCEFSVQNHQVSYKNSNTCTLNIL